MAGGLWLMPNTTLINCGVYNCDFSRNTYYTWTTEKQIRELSQNKILLTKSKSDKNEYSFFDFALRDKPLTKNVFASLLREKQFAKKRFAWVSCFATIMGWSEETYGNRAIKIVLKPDAIIGGFDPSNLEKPFVFYDLKNKKLTEKFVLKNKNRIAAIYFLYNQNPGKKRAKGKTPHGICFREFVIINEQMIKTWCCGTEDIRKQLLAETHLLKGFKNKAKNKPPLRNHTLKAWQNAQHISKSPKDCTTFYSTICFKNNNYLFSRRRIGKIIQTLNAVAKTQTNKIVCHT